MFISLTWPRFLFYPQKQNKVESSTEKGSGPLPRNDKCLCRVSQYCMYGQLMLRKHVPSAGLEQQNGHLTQVKVNEMLGLMSHVAAKVSPNDAVPGWVVFFVKLLCGTKTYCVNQIFGQGCVEV